MPPPLVLLPLRTFDDVARAVVNGEADFGVLPVSNRIAGPVHEALDALDRYASLEPVREHSLPVHLALLGLHDSSEGKIFEVLSHRVALRQCTRWLAEHPRVRAVEAPDTAGAARLVALRRDRHVAAIAAPWAAEHYDLTVLREHLEDDPLNETRFVLVRRRAAQVSG